MKNRYAFLYSAFIILVLLRCNRQNFGGRSEIFKEHTELLATVYSDTTYKITDGLYGSEVAYMSSEGKAMKIFILEVDLKKSSLDIQVTMPNGENKYGMQKMTEQASFVEKQGNKVWAGFNADFYNMKTGVPIGIVYKNGEELKKTIEGDNFGFFAVTEEKKALVGTKDEYAKASQSLKFKEAVGGGVMLLKDGEILPQSNKALEPRTCVGISADSTKLFMLAVDGRNVPYSNGMSYIELAACLKALGAETAINLDGGGSTTYFIRKEDKAGNLFEIRNKPSDAKGERAVANGIVIVSNKK